MKTTGQKIKSLRVALGLSQEQLSDIIDVAHKSIYRYETGKSLPDTTTLVKLATYFDVSTDYLLGLSGLKNQSREEYGKIRQSGKYNEIYKRYLQSREPVILMKTRHTFGSFRHGRMGTLYMADRPSGAAGQMKPKRSRSES